MKFIYHKKAGDREISIEGKLFSHVFVSRRANLGDILPFQNLKDNKRFFYEVVELKKSRASLKLKDSCEIENKSLSNKKVALAIVDPKDLKESVRALAQIGQSEFIFFYATRSQRNYKVNVDKLADLIIKSYEISGLNKFPKITIYKSINELLKNEPGNIFMLDVGGKHIDSEKDKIDVLLVGPEGGFTDEEKAIFKGRIVSFSHEFTLTAKVASIAGLAKLIL